MYCVAVCCGVLRCAAVCCSVFPRLLWVCDVLQSVALRRPATHSTTLQHTALHCNAPHHTLICIEGGRSTIYIGLFWKKRPIWMRHLWQKRTTCLKECNTLSDTHSHLHWKWSKHHIYRAPLTKEPYVYEALLTKETYMSERGAQILICIGGGRCTILKEAPKLSTRVRKETCMLVSFVKRPHVIISLFCQTRPIHVG